MNKKIKEKFNLLEEKIRRLENKNNFEPKDLIKYNTKIIIFEKEGKKNYYIKKYNIFGGWLTFSSYLEDKLTNVLSPEFDNEKELNIWILENYKRINKEYDIEKNKGDE